MAGKADRLILAGQVVEPDLTVPIAIRTCHNSNGVCPPAAAMSRTSAHGGNALRDGECGVVKDDFPLAWPSPASPRGPVNAPTVRVCRRASGGGCNIADHPCGGKQTLLPGILVCHGDTAILRVIEDARTVGVLAHADGRWADPEGLSSPMMARAERVTCGMASRVCTTLRSSAACTIGQVE